MVLFELDFRDHAGLSQRKEKMSCRTEPLLPDGLINLTGRRPGPQRRMPCSIWILSGWSAGTELLLPGVVLGWSHHAHVPQPTSRVEGVRRN